jgi:hypothetical protein
MVIGDMIVGMGLIIALFGQLRSIPLQDGICDQKTATWQAHQQDPEIGYLSSFFSSAAILQRSTAEEVCLRFTKAADWQRLIW